MFIFLCFSTSLAQDYKDFYMTSLSYLLIADAILFWHVMIIEFVVLKLVGGIEKLSLSYTILSVLLCMS